MGNDTTDTDSTLESMLADPPELARDPSLPQCDRSTNKSAYWSPLISWGGTPVTPNRMGAYYVALSGAKQTQAFPMGFEMIAYSEAAATRSDLAPLADGAKAKLYWHCGAVKTVGDSKRQGKPYPPTSCDEENPTLGLTVVFPQCWDGGPFDVVGGANVRHAVNRACPEGFPVRLPSLHMLLDYDLPQNEGPLKVLGPEGLEEEPSFMHADYKNAEDQEKLTRECIRQAGDAKTPKFCRHGDNKVLTPRNVEG